MHATEEKVRFSAFLTTPKPAPAPVVRGDEWFEWVDNQGNTVQLCLVIDSAGGPPRIMADRNGNVSVHDPYPWLVASFETEANLGSGPAPGCRIAE